MLQLMNEDECIDAKTLVREWGLPSEKKEFIEIAEKSLELSYKRFEDILVDWGYASRAFIEERLKEKPANVLFLTYISDDIPELREGSILQQKILTLQKRWPYLDEINHPPHPNMKNKNIFAECDKRNSILLNVNDECNFLLFSRIDDLLEYQTQGREARLEDPIRRETKNSLSLGVGNAQVIARQLSLLRAEDSNLDLLGNDAIENMWEETTTSDSVALRKLSRLISDSMLREVTDIAIDTMRDGTSEIKVRLFGDMSKSPTLERLDIAETHEVIRFLMQKSRAEVQGSRLIQPADGQFIFSSMAGEASIRASFIPIDRGRYDIETISASLRILPRQKGKDNLKLKPLSIESDIIEDIMTALSYSQGMIVLAGPTNSGKSTTIAGMVGEHVSLFGSTKKRISLEDPVERFLPDILQISISQHQKEAFPKLMKALLRHDPDLIWIGEVRDELVADTCIRAATSGHQVLTTIHANDTVLAWKTLINMIEPGRVMDLNESLSMIISQRLVKKVCKYCSETREPTDKERKKFETYCKKNDIANYEIPKTVVQHREEGCRKCSKGISGVVPINEVLPVSRAAKDVMLEDKFSYNELAKHRSHTLFSSAYELVEKHEIEFSDMFI